MRNDRVWRNREKCKLKLELDAKNVSTVLDVIGLSLNALVSMKVIHAMKLLYT